MIPWLLPQTPWVSIFGFLPVSIALCADCVLALALLSCSSQ